MRGRPLHGPLNGGGLFLQHEGLLRARTEIRALAASLVVAAHCSSSPKSDQEKRLHRPTPSPSPKPRRRRHPRRRRRRRPHPRRRSRRPNPHAFADLVEEGVPASTTTTSTTASTSTTTQTSSTLVVSSSSGY